MHARRVRWKTPARTDRFLSAGATKPRNSRGRRCRPPLNKRAPSVRSLNRTTFGRAGVCTLGRVTPTRAICATGAPHPIAAADLFW